MKNITVQLATATYSPRSRFVLVEILGEGVNLYLEDIAPDATKAVIIDDPQGCSWGVIRTVPDQETAVQLIGAMDARVSPGSRAVVVDLPAPAVADRAAGRFAPLRW